MLFVGGAVSAWAQKEAHPKQQPIQCLVTYIPAEQDPKPVFQNTGNAESDKYSYEKAYNSWRTREELRNPTPAPAPQPVEQPATILTQTTIKVPEKQLINPIQYLIDKGVTTAEQLKMLAPHMPLLAPNVQDNEQINDYLETNLRIWTEVYPREVEALYNKVIKPEDLQKIPIYKE